MPLFGTIINAPSASTILTDVGGASAPIFADLWPFVVVASGIALAIAIAVLIVRMFLHHK